jgi:[calcium/calmodulin-dependent protein kinase] kinase
MIIGTPVFMRRRQMTIETDVIQRQESLDGDLCINKYKVLDVIGQGSFGLVRKAVDDDGKPYAMKIVSKRRMRRHSVFLGTPPRRRSITPQRKSDTRLNEVVSSGGSGMSSSRSPLASVYREIAILKKLSHNNMVQLIEVLDDPLEDELILVFEYIERGPLMNIPLDRKFTEDEARNYFIQLILGLEYLHNQKVIHRDIKPSNLLLGNDGQLKIADFGVSEEFEEEDVTLSHTAGTPAFMAPETLDINNRHFKGRAVDLWSVGITLYCMIFGQLPFSSPVITELHEMIREEEVVFPEETSISPELEDLILRLLEKNPDLRLTIPEIREHPWITKSGHILISTEENCGSEIEVNEDEVKEAVTKSSYPIHILIMIKKMAKAKSLKNPFARRQSYSPESSPLQRRKSASESRKVFANTQMPTIEVSSFEIDDHGQSPEPPNMK